MTDKVKSNANIIHSMLHQSYRTSGKLLATLEASSSSPESIVRIIELMYSQLERGVIEMRNLCENDRPNELIELGKPTMPHLDVAGKVDVDRWGWIHIELNSLLPHCRFTTPAYLTDTIVRLRRWVKRVVIASADRYFFECGFKRVHSTLVASKSGLRLEGVE